MGQHCTCNFLVQCCFREIKTTLHMVIFLRKDDCMIWANIAPINFLCNVVSAIFEEQKDCGPILSEAAFHRCSSKQLFLKISQYSQEKTCVGVFFNKNAALKASNFIKNRLQHSAEYCEIFNNTYFEEHLPTTAFGVSPHFSFFFLINWKNTFDYLFFFN